MMELTNLRAALAGIISFISPCVLPLIPVYCSLLVALSGAGPRDKACNRRPVLYSLSFIGGFLAIFMAVSGSSLLGGLIAEHGKNLRTLSGLLLALLGIYTFSKAVFAVLSQNGRVIPGIGAAAYPAALFIGIGVASGWTPCIGPTLGNILVRASAQGTASSGMFMLALYAVGLATPFLVVALVTNILINSARKNSIAMGLARVVSGSVLASVGYILATDNLRQLTTLFPDIISF